MKTLIIYDNTGKIFSIQTGSYEVPEGGIQYIEVDVPEGMSVKAVDVSGDDIKLIYFDDVPTDKIADALVELEKLKKVVGNEDDAITDSDMKKNSIMARLSAIEFLIEK